MNLKEAGGLRRRGVMDLSPVCLTSVCLTSVCLTSVCLPSVSRAWGGGPPRGPQPTGLQAERRVAPGPPSPPPPDGSRGGGEGGSEDMCPPKGIWGLMVTSQIQRGYRRYRVAVKGPSGCGRVLVGRAGG